MNDQFLVRMFCFIHAFDGSIELVSWVVQQHVSLA